MKYFKLISENIPVSGLLDEIADNDDAWLADTSRQDKIKVQRETNTIFLRSAVSRLDLHPNENQESRLTRMSARFPKALKFMNSVGTTLNSELSRATIVRLAPNGTVHRHIDVGSYYLIRNRFHLVLESPAGSTLISGDETIRMRAGELWWFDNKQHHMALNNADAWRIHYIFDLLPAQHVPLARNPVPLSEIENENEERVLDHHHAS